MATCFGRMAAIFSPTYTDQVPSMYYRLVVHGNMICISRPEDGCNAAETCCHEPLIYSTILCVFIIVVYDVYLYIIIIVTQFVLCLSLCYAIVFMLFCCYYVVLLVCCSVIICVVLCIDRVYCTTATGC